MSKESSQSIKSDRLSKSSLARMAGNIAAGVVGGNYGGDTGLYRAELIATESVRLARLIAAELDAEHDAAKARP